MPNNEQKRPNDGFHSHVWPTMRSRSSSSQHGSSHAVTKLEREEASTLCYPIAKTHIQD